MYHKDDIYKENRATVFESYTVDSKSVSITRSEEEIFKSAFNP